MSAGGCHDYRFRPCSLYTLPSPPSGQLLSFEAFPDMSAALPLTFPRSARQLPACDCARVLPSPVPGAWPAARRATLPRFW